jgi:hypothetical protein
MVASAKYDAGIVDEYGCVTVSPADFRLRNPVSQHDKFETQIDKKSRNTGVSLAKGPTSISSRISSSVIAGHD